MGSIISRHEKRMAEIVEQKSRDILLTAIQRYAAAHTAEPRPARSIFPATK